MSPTLLSTLALLFFSFTHNANAGWRMELDNLVTARMDPLVSPNGIASHVHNVVGGSEFTTTYNYDALRQSSCTSNVIPDDKSNYWAPAVYYKHRENGTLSLVPSDYGIYYLHRGTEKDIRQFPAGLRMIAGSPTRSTMSDIPADKAISFLCLDNKGTNVETYTLPNRHCPDGFLMHIIFQSCWNGKDVTSGNFKDHVSYPVNTHDGGTCPTTHPVRLITMRMEQVIHSQNFEYYDGGFVLSTGDNVGYSSHADFANGWDASDNSILQRAINTCTDPKDRISECPVLNPLKNYDYHLCRPESKVLVEDVGFYGNLKKVPGDNAIWGGNVTKVSTGSITPPWGSPYSTLPSNWVEYGCIYGGNADDHYMTGDQLVDPYMYPGLCVDHCNAKGFSLAGVKAGQTCYCANEITNGGSMTILEKKLCSTVCPGSRYEFCGWDRMINLYKKTNKSTGPTNNKIYPPAGAKLTKVYTSG